MRCCDGTGWTGVEGAPCAIHYNSVGDLFAFGHSEVIE